MRHLIAFLFLMISAQARCQEYNSPLGKGKKNRDVCFRGELGWNRSWFLSLGASYVYSNINSHSPIFWVAYAAAEANLATYNSNTPFYSYKAGFETGGLLGLGAEVRNNTDFAGKDHIIFTPKIGLCAFGYVNMYYGYNVFRSADNLFGIGHSQLSLSVNLNRRLLHEAAVPSK